MKTAAPYLMNVQCGPNRRLPLDMRIEDYGLGILPEKYERELEEYFDTTDKRVMQLKALRMKQVPVLCPGNVVELVDKDTGDMLRKVAKELVSVANAVLSDRD
jgi:hypothetical protein